MASSGGPTQPDDTPPPASTGAADSTGAAESTTSIDSTDGSDSSDSTETGDMNGETGDMEVCEVSLPPPAKCGASDAPPAVIIEGSWPVAGGEPVDSLVAPDEPDFGGFIERPDGGSDPFECDIFAQDCPAGEKCMPWGNDGGNWNATRCSPVAAMPAQVGETCTVEGSGTSGIDDCDLGLMCWDVDAETSQGECIEMCGCTEASPVCNTANTTCAISNEGALALCLPVCNPLDPLACPSGQACYPFEDTFLCAPDASGDQGAPGDSCQFINTCDAGTFCLVGDIVPGCTDVGCCSPVCTPGDDSACLPGQSCLPWYEDGAAPDECLGTVGVCSA
ncbi:MAG: hypothetical protein AAF799_36890 [Myxococcota bacterium]